MKLRIGILIGSALALAYRAGDADGAEKHYRAALKRRASLFQAAENLGVLEQNQGHEKDAVKIYEEIASKYPESGGARARLAAVLLHKDNERAIEMSRQA